MLIWGELWGGLTGMARNELPRVKDRKVLWDLLSAMERVCCSQAGVAEPNIWPLTVFLKHRRCLLFWHSRFWQLWENLILGYPKRSSLAITNSCDNIQHHPVVKGREHSLRDDVHTVPVMGEPTASGDHRNLSECRIYGNFFKSDCENRFHVSYDHKMFRDHWFSGWHEDHWFSGWHGSSVWAFSAKPAQSRSLRGVQVTWKLLLTGLNDLA